MTDVPISSGSSGPLWDVPREVRRELVMVFQGVRVRVRYSLDGSLNKQATIEGIVHVRESDITIFHVQRDQTRPDSSERRYTPVIFSRIIDISPMSTINAEVSVPPEYRRRDDACQSCLGMYQPPHRHGKPKHCGKCPCCINLPETTE